MRLADLLLNHVPMSWGEALALVQSLAAMRLPDEPAADIVSTVTEITLQPDGTLAAVSGSTPAVSATGLAMILRHALPEPGKAQGSPPPGALRYTVSRALNEVEAPPIVTVRQLAETLARFEKQDRAAALAAVHARVRGGKAVPSPPPQPAAADPLSDLPLFVDTAGAALSSDETSPSRGRLLDDRPRAAVAAPRRKSGVRVAQALAALVVVLSGGMVGYLAYAEWPRLEHTAQSIGEAARARWEEIRPARGPEQDATGPAAPDPGEPGASDAPGPQRAELSSEPLTGTTGHGGLPAGPPAGAAPLTQDRRERAADGPPPPVSAGEATESGGEPGRPALPDETESREASEGPESEVNREGRVVQSLDAGRRPIFSPSFAFDGSAVFFHQDTAGGSAGLREAREDSTGEMLHVVSLLDDGARNYHPRLSPDGKLVAFDSDRDGVRGVYLSARDGTNVRRVSGPGYSAVPSWSPDGSRLAFIRAEAASAGVWNIWILSVGSGEMQRLTSHSFGQPWGASWFPDGRRVCYSHEDRLIVLDTVSGSSQLYPSPRKGRLVRTPAVSPDGRRVVFQLYRDGAWLLDLADGSMRRVLADPTAEEFSWSPDGRRVAFHSRRDGQWGVWVMAGD